jgi:hypothetical protein
MITCNDQHQYIDGDRRYVSVTQILSDLFPYPMPADSYFLQRGSAAHACYAMLADGVEFDCDPVCTLYVEGWKSWAAAVKPMFVVVEDIVVSKAHQYAGRLDAIAEIGGNMTLIDYKGSFSKTIGHQLAAYALAYEEMTKVKINNGMGVIIDDSGKWSIERYDLKKLRNEWIICRSYYAIKQRMGKV